MRGLIGWIFLGMAAILLLGIALGFRFPFSSTRNVTQPNPSSTETATTTTDQQARQVPQNTTRNRNQTGQQSTGQQSANQNVAQRSNGTTGATNEGIYDQNTGRTFYYDPTTGRFSDPTTGNLYDYDPSTNTFTLYQGNRPIRGGW